MVKQLLTTDSKDSKLKQVQLKNSLDEVLSRIEKLQDLLVDGNIEQNQYSETMKRYTTQKFSLIEQINNINHSQTAQNKNIIIRFQNINYHAHLLTAQNDKK